MSPQGVPTRSDGTPLPGFGDNGIDSRAALKLKSCVPCKQRGHHCEAQTEIDGEPWCNPCADGDPCMNELIERRRRDRDVSATSKLPSERYRGVRIRQSAVSTQPSAKTGVAQVSSPVQGEESAGETGNSAHEPVGDNHGQPDFATAAHEETGVTDVTSTDEREPLPAVEPQADVPGFDQWLAERDRYREKRKQQKKEREMARQCKCGILISPLSKTGQCSPCQQNWRMDNPKREEVRVKALARYGDQAVSKKKPEPAEQGKKKRAPDHGDHARSRAMSAITSAVPHKNGAAYQNGDEPDPKSRCDSCVRPDQVKEMSGRPLPEGVGMLMVTEAHLNNYLLRLPLERKTALVQQDLEAQLV